LPMKPRSFVPTVAEISASEAGEVPGLEAVISYWTEGTYSAQGWFREINELWGPSGFVMRRGEDVLGFAVYGPPGYLPHAGRYPVGPLSEDAALLAYVGGVDTRARRHLLVRVLRDLKHRGVGGVEAVAADLPVARHISTGTLLESGWQPVRRGWYRGRPYTLVRTDLGSAVEVGELARGLIGRVKLPRLRSPSPAPGAFVQNRVRPVMAGCGAAGSRS
jgi:hypothetical protein